MAKNSFAAEVTFKHLFHLLLFTAVSARNGLQNIDTRQKIIHNSVTTFFLNYNIIT